MEKELELEGVIGFSGLSLRLESGCPLTRFSKTNTESWILGPKEAGLAHAPGFATGALAQTQIWPWAKRHGYLRIDKVCSRWTFRMEHAPPC